MKACIYPGTFDPITNGHIDVIKRATKIFDKVVVAVAKSESKNPLFKLDKRVKMTEIATKNLSNVSVISFDNLLVEFAKEQGINTIIRGLRAVSDFEYELQIGYANATLWDEIETIYLMPSLKNVHKLVPNEILNIMKG